MTDQELIEGIVDGVVRKLRGLATLPGWPEGAAAVSEPVAAGMLAIGSEKLMDLRRAGLISHHRLGHSVRYTPEDLTRYLEHCRQNGERQPANGDVRAKPEQD